jgi:hypothetical protein
MDMPDIMTLFPNVSVNNDISTTAKMRTPIPSEPMPFDDQNTPLDMQVYHVPEELSSDTIKMCNTLIDQINANEPRNVHNSADDYNESLCNALLDTIEKASGELKVKTTTRGVIANTTEQAETQAHLPTAGQDKDTLEENPLPADLRAIKISTQPDINATHYEDISSADSTPKFDVKEINRLIQKVKVPDHLLYTPPAARDNSNKQDLPETIVTHIEPQSMFTHLVPANTTNLANPPPLRVLSSAALTQANIISINGTKMPSTEIKCYESQNKLMQDYPRFVTQIGANSYTPYKVYNKGSPRTWYHVEEEGALITVNENVEDDDHSSDLTPECPTPVMDEWPSPSCAAATLTTPNTQEDLTPLAPKDQGTSTTLETLDSGCNPMEGPTLQERGMVTDTQDVRDNSCSPRHQPTMDTGTDPINWWLEATRQELHDTNYTNSK